jgi:soluble lytic murein transglycosylase-like protein
MRGRRRRRARGFGLGAAAVVAAVVAVAVVVNTSSPPRLPLPGVGRPARAGDPFAYVPERESDFVARATAGSAHVLYSKSPGGAIATASRVAALRSLVDRAAAGSGVDPNLLEALVFLESAGRPDAIAGGDPAGAAGLAQILPGTGQTLLGMRIDLARSRRLTASLDAASAAGRAGEVARLERARARVDDRFDPRLALRAAVRYLEIARARFRRIDLAIVSYHMGIGNLQHVLDLYDGGRAVPYAQLYFDTAPDRHPRAWALLSGFGDDSSLYYWRVLGAAQIMRLYRHDRAALVRLDSLQTATGSAAEVLHPPERTPPFADPDALYRAYAARAILPLPGNPAALGLSYDPGIGSLARRIGGVPALYRGLRVPALDLLIELAARVRALSHGARPLIVAGAVTDLRYQAALGVPDPPAAAGWSFTLLRRYASATQAEVLQAMLDRLQVLNVIAWERYPAAIEVTVASDASRVIVDGP